LIYILIFFRLFKVPIISKKDLEKKTVPRGHTDVLYKDDQVLVAWKDNKGVYMASNKFGADTTNNCRRFCRTERKYVTVPIPTMVQRYNTGMGGVDLLDNMVAVYRIPFRKCECGQRLEAEDAPDRSQRTIPELPARAVHRHADGARHKACQEEVRCWQ